MTAAGIKAIAKQQPTEYVVIVRMMIPMYFGSGGGDGGGKKQNTDNKRRPTSLAPPSLVLSVVVVAIVFATSSHPASAATCPVSDSEQAKFSGDGVCDSDLNVDSCGWDDGDCCRQSCVQPFDTNRCPLYGTPFDCQDPK